MVERTSYRVYTAHELRHMPQSALRASAPPPKTGITGSGVAFMLGVALAIGGASWGAMHYVKPDFVATANAMEAKVSVPTAPGDPAAPPVFATVDPSPGATPAPPPTSASSKQLAKPKKGRRQARPRPADSGSSTGESVPPNPFDELARVDRAPTVRE
jgi:hypothetical protein